ncbi:MAG: hypothetical protein KGY53_05610 [Wenzhouxiangellaceae bacterium]|nr:hypothetical protein [Wenzhouxiangellaceae bacterium]
MKDVTLIEKNGTGIEKNGTGIERSGTGIERNGTGCWGGTVNLLVCSMLLTGLASSAVADLRGFVDLTDGRAEITIADDSSVLSGTGTLTEGYAMIGLGGILGCGAANDVLVEGSGTGRVKVEGSGTGRVKVEGSGTGRVKVEGSGTGRTNVEGSGTGRPNVEGSGTGVTGGSGCTSLLVEGSGTGRVKVEGSGTGRVNVEGSGTGRVNVEGSGTGRVNVEGSGTGRVNVEGSGTGRIEGDENTSFGSFSARTVDQPFVQGGLVGRFAEIALNGGSASVIVYGMNQEGAVEELAVGELPVLDW